MDHKYKFLQKLAHDRKLESKSTVIRDSDKITEIDD